MKKKNSKRKKNFLTEKIAEKVMGFHDSEARKEKFKNLLKPLLPFF
jgi:hypothetical protein